MSRDRVSSVTKKYNKKYYNYSKRPKEENNQNQNQMGKQLEVVE